MKKPLFKNNRGFTLVEVLASITILAIVMLTVGAILANNAGVTKKRMTASTSAALSWTASK
ncbi:PulJ/GspJ family protein [Heyndrickxia coagulans]|uniref:PulJ/GspJ family protein n=1 Tax=Heyndrickxia coagulans TaxID=1398 RepID=UPI001F35688F|nr:prepilin-type N-terminal cleavage/methylation domain-containing protein [Heyndrickxia coagulans]